MKLQKRIVRLLLLAMVGVMTTSCNSTYYQVYEMGSNSLVQKENSMVFENEDVKVLYNLWSNDGRVAFVIENNTPNDIFVDMSQSFLIVNGMANDYYRDREFTTTSLTAVGVDFGRTLWTRQYDVPTRTIATHSSTTHTSTSSVTEREKPVICIPAKSYKSFGSYTLAPTLQIKCSKNVDMPNSHSIVATYVETTSPLKANNRIAYSYDKDCHNLKFIDNDFYVVSVKNYSNNAAVEKVKTKENCYDKQTTTSYQFKIGGPNKFYKTYDGGHFSVYK